MNVRFVPAAAEELAQALAAYEMMQQGLGARFERAFWNAIERIQQSPNAAPLVTKNARRHRLRRFPWGIVYALRSDHLLIVAVMHLHRRPGYWHERIKQN